MITIELHGRDLRIAHACPARLHDPLHRNRPLARDADNADASQDDTADFPHAAPLRRSSACHTSDRWRVTAIYPVEGALIRGRARVTSPGFCPFDKRRHFFGTNNVRESASRG